MSSIIVEVTTSGLDEVIANLDKLPTYVTTETAKKMEQWYNNHYKKTVLEIIETGGMMYGIKPNQEMYARRKASHGIYHPLGILSGRLYGAVAVAQCQIKITRGKEIRFTVVYKEPFYLAYVHEGFTAKGKANNVPVPARPFIEIARARAFPKLLEMLGNLFESLDLTRPVMGGR